MKWPREPGRPERGVFAPFIFAASAGFAAITASMSTLIMAASDGVPAIPAVATATGGTAAVSLAVYISKKLLSGEITPLPVTQLIEKMEAQIEHQNARDQRDDTERAELRELVKQSTQAMFAVHDYLRQQRPAASTTTPPVQR